ncbi:MAG: hypothetical protein Q8907_07455 [Bacteroidota bacterium]|nr:hypothetical protein [Bacteroidota bacterium]
MKKNNLIIILFLLVVFASCTKNKEDYYLKDIQSNERSIIGASVSNQVGSTVITNNDTATTVNLVVYNMDLSKATPKFLLSYGATISPASGSPVDFTKNANNSATYTVTSQSGKTKKWTVICKLFDNPYEGTWTIKSFTFNWDDGNGWGNAGSAEVAKKLPVSATGLDDVLTFGAIEGMTSDGSVYGNYTRTAGADGSFASYVNSTSNRNWDAEFGQLPGGTGKYYIDQNNYVTVVLSTGKSYVSKGKVSYDAATKNLNYGLIPTAKNTGLINWNNYYGDFDNAACCSTKIWYILQKQ